MNNMKRGQIHILDRRTWAARKLPFYDDSC